ncbi:MAG TPA: hypothetical protein VI197_19885 [Polyangiaceae bacterium]
MQKPRGAIAPFLCLVMLSACGGGGSNSSGSANSVGGSAGAVGDGDGGSTSNTAANGGSSSGGTGDMGGASAGGSGGASAGGSGGSSSGGSGGSSAGGSGGSSAGTAGAGGAPEPPTPFEAFCEAYIDYTCDWMLGCRGFTDCDSIGPANFIRSSCETLLPQAIADGDLVFDTDLAETCLPDSLVCYGNPRELTEVGPCRGIVEAKGRIGDDCYRTLGFFDQPCAEGYCDMTDQCPGTCTAYTPDDSPCDGQCQPGSACIDDVCTKLPDVGESCDDYCRYGFPCVEGDDGKICVQPSADGEACDESQPCASGSGCVDGICGAKVELGEECTIHAECPDGARCLLDDDSGMNTCQPLPGVGEMCPFGECQAGLDLSCQDPDPSDADATNYCVQLGGLDDSCEPNGCRSDLWCYYAEDDSEGVCLAQGGPGDFCTTEGSGPFVGYPPCLNYPTLYLCIEEECTAPGAVGDPCIPNDSRSCAEGWCSTETSRCVAPAAEGEVCNTVFTYGNACAQGMYCFCEGADCYYDPLADHGECRPKKAEDAPCQTAIECLSDACNFEENVGTCAEVVDQSACDAPFAPEPEE